MVKRRFRLTRSTDFKRVRSNGKSYAHPLLVLVIMPCAGHDSIRVGVTASKSVGGAVARNRAKRIMREAMRDLLPVIKPGWDMIAIARVPLLSADFQAVQQAMHVLLQRAKLLEIVHEH